eukprot:scaffold31422_cov49-Attheya_sp.AAC.1
MMGRQVKKCVRTMTRGGLVPHVLVFVLVLVLAIGIPLNLFGEFEMFRNIRDGDVDISFVVVVLVEIGKSRISGTEHTAGSKIASCGDCFDFHFRVGGIRHNLGSGVGVVKDLDNVCRGGVDTVCDGGTHHQGHGDVGIAVEDAMNHFFDCGEVGLNDGTISIGNRVDRQECRLGDPNRIGVPPKLIIWFVIRCSNHVDMFRGIEPFCIRSIIVSDQSGVIIVIRKSIWITVTIITVRTRTVGGTVRGVDRRTIAVLNRRTIAVLDRRTVAVLDRRNIAVLDRRTVAVLDRRRTVAVLDRRNIAVLDRRTVAVLDRRNIAVLDRRTIAVLDRRTIAVLDRRNIAVLDRRNIAVLNRRTIAVLDRRTVAVLDRRNIAVLDRRNVAVLDRRTVAVLDRRTIAVLDRRTITVLNRRTIAVLDRRTIGW